MFYFHLIKDVIKCPLWFLWLMTIFKIVVYFPNIWGFLRFISFVDFQFNSTVVGEHTFYGYIHFKCMEVCLLAWNVVHPEDSPRVFEKTVCCWVGCSTDVSWVGLVMVSFWLSVSADFLCPVFSVTDGGILESSTVTGELPVSPCGSAEFCSLCFGALTGRLVSNCRLFPGYGPQCDYERVSAFAVSPDVPLPQVNSRVLALMWFLFARIFLSFYFHHSCIFEPKE